MNINRIASASGLSAPLIRYFASTGLLPRPRPAADSARGAGAHQVRLVRVIDHAHRLGLSLRQIQTLLRRERKNSRPTARYDSGAAEHSSLLGLRLSELKATRDALRGFARAKRRTNAEAARIAMHHVTKLEAKIAAIQVIRTTSGRRD